MTTESTSLMSWNIQSGGFASYDENVRLPAREQAIKSSIEAAKNQYGLDSVTLPDAHRWGLYYDGQDGIAQHLGFKAARYTLLNDERLMEDGGKEIGIAFATNLPIEQSTILDLETRQGLEVIVKLGDKSLQFVSVYLDDIDEDVRIKQIHALDSAIERDIPTILSGDFNMLRPNFENAPLSIQFRDLGVRALAKALGGKSQLGKSINSMNERRAYDTITDLGFIDADFITRTPTAPSKAPLFGIDYVFSRDDVRTSDFNVPSIRQASDHRPIITKIKV